MRLRFIWRGWNPRQTSDRLQRLKHVLSAALLTPYYPPFLSSSGLGSPAEINSLTAVEGTLHRLPSVALPDFLKSPSDFAAAGARPGALQIFQYPLEQTPRVAILAPGFRQTATIKCFDPSDYNRIGKFKPQALAAPISVLRNMASEGVKWPSVSNVLVAFTGVAEGTLREEDRELLWQVYQVPVFEQFRGCDGHVIATECEAHDGLHVVSENAAIEVADRGYPSELLLTSLTDCRYPALRLCTGFTAAMGPETCGCGRSGLRLLEMTRMSRPKALGACA